MMQKRDADYLWDMTEPTAPPCPADYGAETIPDDADGETDADEPED